MHTSDRLAFNETLSQGVALRSPHGNFEALVQSDGNFVVYLRTLKDLKALWATNTNGKSEGPYSLINQSDGNLVLYDKHTKPLWASNTVGKNTGATKLLMQTDGNLVLYDSKETVLWASNSVTEFKGTKYHGKDRIAMHGRIIDGLSITSSNGSYKAVVQGDGNFVLYHGTKALWASGTNGKGSGCSLDVQEDNNLVLYDSKGHALWATSTNGKGSSPAWLLAQDDGNLVLYDGNDKPLWASNTVQVADRVATNGVLHQGHSISSPNKHYKLLMQADGNLVLYKHDTQAIWATNTDGKGSAPYRVLNQSDGNFVVYDHHDKALWASNTNGKSTNQFVALQDDGNLVMYSGSTALWASNTNGK